MWRSLVVSRDCSLNSQPYTTLRTNGISLRGCCHLPLCCAAHSSSPVGQCGVEFIWMPLVAFTKSIFAGFCHDHLETEAQKPAAICSNATSNWTQHQRHIMDYSPPRWKSGSSFNRNASETTITSVRPDNDPQDPCHVIRRMIHQHRLMMNNHLLQFRVGWKLEWRVRYGHNSAIIALFLPRCSRKMRVDSSTILHLRFVCVRLHLQFFCVRIFVCKNGRVLRHVMADAFRTKKAFVPTMANKWWCVRWASEDEVVETMNRIIYIQEWISWLWSWRDE